jgi:hypothetical protein
MSKEAALRAMREAKYAARSAAHSTTAKPAPRLAKPATTEPRKATQPDDAAEATDALCGHRSKNGRTCTREQGHAAKSHRYS